MRQFRLPAPDAPVDGTKQRQLMQWQQQAQQHRAHQPLFALYLGTTLVHDVSKLRQELGPSEQLLQKWQQAQDPVAGSLPWWCRVQRQQGIMLHPPAHPDPWTGLAPPAPAGCQAQPPPSEAGTARCTGWPMRPLLRVAAPLTGCLLPGAGEGCRRSPARQQVPVCIRPSPQ